jgi:hypothetical protein
MELATATGWEMNAQWDPLISSVVAFIRSAKNRSASGGMALSCSETRNQDGCSRYPTAVHFSVNAASDSGR